jgi:signal transduction histidine kinase
LNGWSGRRQRYRPASELIEPRVVVTVLLGARRPDLERRGLALEATLGPAEIAGDERLIARLAANLVGNAMRYNILRGWVKVVTTTRAGHAVLAVSNSGPVVPSDQLGRLVQPFQQLGANRTGHGAGLGLGLSIVDAIATAHNAALSVRARLDGGLAVEVCFPPATGDTVR